MKSMYEIETIKDLGNLLKECDENQLQDIIKSFSESLEMIYHVMRLGQSKDDINFDKWFWSPLDKFPSDLISDKVKNGFTIEVSKNNEDLDVETQEIINNNFDNWIS